MRLKLSWVVVVVLLLGLVSCGSDAAEVLAPGGDALDLVYFSDSGGWGVAEKYGALAAEALGREVRVHDHATGGLAAVRVLDMVRDNMDMVRDNLREEVADAEIIVVYGNPDGSGVDAPQPDMGTCLSTSPHERPAPVVIAVEDLQPYRAVLDDIYAEIWAARGGKPTVLRAVDLYSPVIAPWREAGIEAECVASFEVWSGVIEAAAQANGATFVSVFDLFNGSAHDEDPREKGWIGFDGQHTTVEGAAAIAEALAAVGFEPSEPSG